MDLKYLSCAAFRTLTATKNGPTLYDVCDPLLRGEGPGDAHLRRFYKIALANPALRLVLARAGLPQLRDAARLCALREAIIAARDAPAPDWGAIGRPVAALLDECPQQHPRPPRRSGMPRAPAAAEIERIIRACATHLLGSFARNGFIPAYAAFNLIGDPDFHGRDLIVALQGLDARAYRNATLMFNLARAFIAPSAAAQLLNPPWRGVAEPMWEPVQVRHRSAYYDAFFAEALMDWLGSGLPVREEAVVARRTISQLVDFCVRESREDVRGPTDGRPYTVVTALLTPAQSRFSRFFANIRGNLGFATYVPDCDTTACAISAATQLGVRDAILDQPLVDFYANYQVARGGNRDRLTVPLNDNIDPDGGVLTWIENLAGACPFGNDLDPTLNLDVLEVSFRNHERWRIVEDATRLDVLRGIVAFQRRLADSGAFVEPRSHIYYLPELYCAYFGRCYAAFRALPSVAQKAIDPDGAFDAIRRAVLAYVQDELLAHEMNVFDAALALLALAKLGSEPESFAPALDCIAESFGEGRGRAPFRAYEWNKMKTPTRILVGGPEVTSAFVLSALVHARAAMRKPPAG
jgi:hypothetical protein